MCAFNLSEGAFAVQKKSKDQQPSVDRSSPLWLEALRKEMLKHWSVEQKINAILPVHNIGALSLDTVALKNSLKAEARAWKTLYGKQLISHALKLIGSMSDELQRITRVLTMPAQEVEEMIKIYVALHDAEVFDKQVRAVPPCRTMRSVCRAIGDGCRRLTFPCGECFLRLVNGVDRGD